MSRMHTVTQGECLSSIANYYGLSHWRKIYDNPRNADFKARRPNPNVIYPGDELFIPEKDVREEACVTAHRHKFVITVTPTYLNLRVQDQAKQPITKARYKLVLDNGLELKGTTDSDGLIKQKIPARAEAGSLKIWPNPEDPDTVVYWRVRLGHLNPLETVSGVKGRLQNLGYKCGEVNEVEDEVYEAAVRQFQEEHGLEVDGIVGPQTRAKLQQEHRV